MKVLFLSIAVLAVAAGQSRAAKAVGQTIRWAWPADSGPILSTTAGPVANLAVVVLHGDGSRTPARLQSRVVSRGLSTETWSLDQPAVDVILQYTSIRSIPATRITMHAVNRSEDKASACIAIEAALKQSVNRAILFDFTKAPYVEFAFADKGMTGASWKAETDLNAQMGLYGYPNRPRVYNSWGTVQLCNPLGSADLMHSTLYLPIVSLYDERSGGLVAWCDPRSHIGFDGNRERLRLQHMFFLPPGKGSVDSGFEPGDGTGPWPYVLYLGYSEKPTWDSLYSGFFMATSPDLRGGVRAKSEPGMVALPRLTEGYVPIFKRLGIKYTGGESVSFSYPDGITPEEIRWGLDSGIYNWAQDGTIGMATDLEKSPVPIWEPQWIMERYESSLIKDSKGETEWCWQGKFANPSPSFPFGRDRLAAVKELFKQPFGGFYIDLYLSGAGADWAHPVDAMPFYPMNRAYYEYMGAIATETRKLGLFYNINAPHPSNLAGKFADWMTFDTDAPIWLWCRAYGELTGINVQFWTNLQDTVPKLRASLSDALAYGIITGPYVVFGYLLPGNTPISDADKQELIALYERHYRIAYEVGRAKLVKGTSTGGRPGPFIYYRGKDRNGYITVQNSSSAAREIAVPLELDALGMSPGGGVKLSVWDIDSGMSRERVVQPESRSTTIRVEPGMTSVIRIRPA